MTFQWQFHGNRQSSRVRFLVLAAVLLCGASAFARMGAVRLLTGETMDGRIRVTPDGVVVVNAVRNSIARIALTNLGRISFPVEKPAGSSSGEFGEALPAAWRETDIGAVFTIGSTRVEPRAFTVRSSGLNIDGDRDSFHYVYKPVRGDSEIVAEVTTIQYTHPNAKAGLMMRENLGEYSRNVMLGLTAMRGGVLQVRANEHGNTESALFTGIHAPYWLKLKRRGDEFSAYLSRNGRVWSLVERVSVTMAPEFYVGLAVTSAREGMLNWTTFSKVREGSRLANEDFTPQIELVSGSVVTGRPVHASEDEFVFSGEPKVVRVPTARVARVAYQPLTGDFAWRTRVSRSGVWVNTGDFFDGDFRGIEGHKLSISSVLYGLRTFDVDEEVLAVVLQPRKTQRTQFEIETSDGSLLLASDLTLGDGEFKLREAALGEVRVPAFEVLEIRRR
jgi:hypothetical protein